MQIQNIMQVNILITLSYVFPFYKRFETPTMSLLSHANYYGYCLNNIIEIMWVNTFFNSYCLQLS